MTRNVIHSSAFRSPRSLFSKAVVLSALALLSAAPAVAMADVHAGCFRCKRWVLISKKGIGFLRHHFVVCGKCLDRAGKDLRDKYNDVNNRLNDKRKQKPSYDDAVKKKRNDFNDHVNRQRADHKNRGFGYDKGWTRDRDGKRRDDRYDRLKKDLASEQRKADTLNQQIKELVQEREALAKKIP